MPEVKCRPAQEEARVERIRAGTRPCGVTSIRLDRASCQPRVTPYDSVRRGVEVVSVPAGWGARRSIDAVTALLRGEPTQGSEHG